MSVEIDITEEGGATIVALVGELDLPGADKVGRKLGRLENGKPAALILDLRGLSFMDSSGLHMVLTADARAKEEGRKFAVVRGPEAVDRVFRLTKAEGTLQMLEEPSELR